MMRRSLLLILLLLFVASTHAQVVPSQTVPKLDKYGGLLNVATTATGYWYTHKFGNRWMLVTPEGHAFWPIGAFVFDPNQPGNTYKASVIAKYGDNSITWAPAAIRRARGLTINSTDGPTGYAYPFLLLGNWPDGLQPEPLAMIYDYPFNRLMTQTGQGCTQNSKDIMQGMNFPVTGVYTGGDENDPYDPCWSSFVTYAVTNVSDPDQFQAAAASPFTIGFEIGEVDDSYGIGKASHEHLAPEILASSPYQTYNAVWSVLYSTDRVYHAKAALQTFLQNKYATIGALNTAWGSSYTGFSSDATNQVDTIGTGNGTNLTFSSTLTYVPDPDSLWLKVGTSVVAGENTQDVTAISPATCNGPTISSCTVNHTTKAFSVTFTAGNAPGNGVSVTADYYHGGWGVGAQLMDENGSHSWMPNSSANWVSLGNLTSSMQTDMNNFLKNYSVQFFKTAHDIVKAAYPNALFIGLNQMGTPCDATPSRPVLRQPVLQGMGPYVDILPISYYCGDGQDQAALDLIAQNAGDLPILDTIYSYANNDSALFPTSVSNPADVLSSLTQNAKGTVYTSRLDALYSASTSGAVPNSQPNLGTRIWSWHDEDPGGANWGINSIYDNVYDGILSRNYGCTVGHPETCSNCLDAWGWHCGAETTPSRTNYLIGTGDGVRSTFSTNIQYLPIQPSSVTVSYITENQLASDNFQRADANPIGGNWTTVPGENAMQLVSHAAESTTTGNPATNAAYYNNATWTNDQYSEITIGTFYIPGGSVNPGAIVRQNGTGNFYACIAQPTQYQRISKFSGGTETTLVSSNSLPVASGDKIKCRAQGTQLSLIQNGGAANLTVTDSTYTSGNAGMMIQIYGNNPITNSTISAWDGGSLVTSSCSDNGSGALSGAGCSSGSIQYVNPGAVSVTTSTIPANGVQVVAAFITAGSGGYLPSYMPAVVAENVKILHNLEAALWSPPVITSSTNLARYMPISASSFLPLAGSGGNNYIPSRAIDGNTVTTWRPGAADPQWIRLDEGSATIGKVILRWLTATGYWTNYTIDTSNDGLSWTTQFTKTGGTGGVETDTFTPVSARYIRVNGTARSGTPALEEFEVYSQ